MTNNQTKYFVIGAILLAIIFLVSVPFFVHSDNPKPQSTFVLSPTVVPSPTPYIEPEIFSWQTYSNDTYQFSINYPSDWKKQEYKSSGQNGGMTIAFSPDTLPCANCTYVHEGYYSIRVYNQSSDPILYGNYQDIVKNLQNSKTDRKLTLDGVDAILHGDALFLSHNGWIYQLSFDRPSGSTTITTSKIFLTAVRSFTFTNLKFIK